MTYVKLQRWDLEEFIEQIIIENSEAFTSEDENWLIAMFKDRFTLIGDHYEIEEEFLLNWVGEMEGRKIARSLGDAGYAEMSIDPDGEIRVTATEELKNLMEGLLLQPQGPCLCGSGSPFISCCAPGLPCICGSNRPILRCCTRLGNPYPRRTLMRRALF